MLPEHDLFFFNLSLKCIYFIFLYLNFVNHFLVKRRDLFRTRRRRHAGELVVMVISKLYFCGRPPAGRVFDNDKLGRVQSYI